MIAGYMRLSVLLLLFFIPILLLGDEIKKSYYFTKLSNSAQTTFKAYPGDNLSLQLQFDIESLKSKRDNIDVLFLIDNTGSMSDLIQAVKNNISPIYQNVSSQFKSTRIAIATISDHNCDKDWELISDFSSDTSTLEENIQSIGLSKGKNGDWPEDYLYGLHKAKQLKWRNEATKLIVLIGDATYHDPDKGEDKESGTDDDLTTSDVLDELKSDKIIVSTIYCDENAKDSMVSIADYTGGISYFYTSNRDSMVNKIDVLIQNMIKPRLLVDKEYTAWQTNNHYPFVSFLIPQDTSRDNRYTSVNIAYLGEIVGSLKMNIILGKPWGLWIISSVFFLLLFAFLILYLYSIYMLISLMDTTAKIIHTIIMSTTLLIYFFLIYKIWELMNERWFPLIWSGFWW